MNITAFRDKRKDIENSMKNQLMTKQDDIYATEQSEFSFTPDNIAGIRHKMDTEEEEIHKTQPKPHRSEYLMDKGYEMASSERRGVINRTNEELEVVELDSDFRRFDNPASSRRSKESQNHQQFLKSLHLEDPEDVLLQDIIAESKKIEDSSRKSEAQKRINLENGSRVSKKLVMSQEIHEPASKPSPQDERIEFNLTSSNIKLQKTNPKS